MKIKKIRLNKIKAFLIKLPRILGEKALLTFWGLLIIFLIMGIFLFYKYIFLTQKTPPEISEKPLQFNEKLFQEILKKSEEREKKFEETEFKQYPDPFRGPTVVEEIPSGTDLTPALLTPTR